MLRFQRQTFSWNELEPLIEILLFEHDALVNARYVACCARFTGANRVVISLFATRERGQQIVADRANVELVQVAAMRRRCASSRRRD